MKKTTMIFVTMIMVVASLAAGITVATDGPSNVVLIITDYQDYDDLNYHSNLVKTLIHLSINSTQVILRSF